MVIFICYSLALIIALGFFLLNGGWVSGSVFWGWVVVGVIVSMFTDRKPEAKPDVDGWRHIFRDGQTKL